MPIPTTNVLFSDIQTEFGGANPVSVSEYVKGGAYVPSNQTTSATDGVAIPTSTASEIRIGMFRGLTKTVSGAYNTAAYGGLRSVPGTSSSTAYATLATDGSISSNTDAGAGSWWSPTTASIGTGKYVRFSVTGGTPFTSPAMTAGTWYQLNASRSFGVTRSGTGVSTRVFTLEFSNDASTVVATKTLTIRMETGNIV